jgi:hypothetical protein
MRLAGVIPGQVMVLSIGEERAAAKRDRSKNYFETSCPKYLSEIAW